MRLVISTAPPDKAPELARAIVEERLVACVNILPGARSFYRWKGEVCDDEESVLLMKTAPARVDALRERYVELHPYEVCEFIVLDITDGYPPYLDWIDHETRPAS